MDGFAAGAMGLEFAQALRADYFTIHAVGQASLVKFIQAGPLLGFNGHNHLAATTVWNPMLGTKGFMACLPSRQFVPSAKPGL